MRVDIVHCHNKRPAQKSWVQVDPSPVTEDKVPCDCSLTLCPLCVLSWIVHDVPRKGERQSKVCPMTLHPFGIHRCAHRASPNFYSSGSPKNPACFSTVNKVIKYTTGGSVIPIGGACIQEHCCVNLLRGCPPFAVMKLAFLFHPSTSSMCCNSTWEYGSCMGLQV